MWSWQQEDSTEDARSLHTKGEESRNTEVWRQAIIVDRFAKVIQQIFSTAIFDFIVGQSPMLQDVISAKGLEKIRETLQHPFYNISK